MAEKATIARPYARAAFAHANAARELPAWSTLLAAGAAVVSDPRVEPLLGNPQVRSEQLVELIAEAAKAAGGEHGRNFLRTLAESHRLGLLPDVAAQYEVLRADAEHVADVELIAAAEVPAAQAEKLAAALKARLGREIRLHTRIDPTLVGGAIVRSGDLVIDGSLQGRLARLAAAMTA